MSSREPHPHFTPRWRPNPQTSQMTRLEGQQFEHWTVAECVCSAPCAQPNAIFQQLNFSAKLICDVLVPVFQNLPYQNTYLEHGVITLWESTT